MSLSLLPAAAIRPSVTELQKLAERIQSQLDFAKQILELDGDGQNEAILTQAADLAAKVFASDDLPAVRQGVKDIEALLSPIGKLAKGYTIYCVGHAHIDMNWMWSWPETVAVTNDTFSTVLKLMDEFPGFRFSQSQASVYAIIEQFNPAMLKAIRKRVKEKRWEVTASHWVEGDRNMVSGEALTRHLLHTRAYLKSILNLSPEDCPIDWSPDTFGHPLTVPMYLTRGGVKYIYLHRPGHWGEKRPQAFWWQSQDGSRVLVRNDMDNGYNGHIRPATTEPLLKFRRETGLKFVMYVYGVGDHGGGPTRVDLAHVVELNTWPIFPNVLFARAQDFYDRLAREGESLPTLKCELNPEVAGCYTTQTLIKRSNRIAENRLCDAEAISTVALPAVQQPYPKKRFVEAWRDTLFCHFHDILPGSNVHDSRTYMHGLFQKTIATTSIVETQALRALASRVKTTVKGMDARTPSADSYRAATGAGAGIGAEKWLIDTFEQSDGANVRPLVIFNTCAWERSDIVEATLWSDSPGWTATDEARNRKFSVRLPDGTIVPAQKLDTGSSWGHLFTRIAFPARVPSLGYTTCHVIEDSSDTVTPHPALNIGAAAPNQQGARQLGPTHHCSYLRRERPPEGLENELISVELDVQTGGIKRLLDKRFGIELIAPAQSTPLLEYALERTHGMSAWLIENHGKVEQPEVIAIERKLSGPYKATIDARLKIHESDLTLTYELRANDPQLYLHISGMWFQRGSDKGYPSLRLALPLKLNDTKARYEIPFGSIERDLAHDEEAPALNWCMVSGESDGKLAGVLLSNDCKHGHALNGNTLRMTLIRSSVDPDPLPEIGRHEIHLSLLPFSGPMPVSDAIQTGRNLNRPLRVCGTTVHDGALAPTASALATSGEGVLATDIKHAEQGDAVIVRFLNPTPDAIAASATLDKALLGSFRSATEVDLMERPVKPSSARLKGRKLGVSVPAYAIASVKLTR